jgi:glycosyltransferase involved in cell wall biosynthesis
LLLSRLDKQPTAAYDSGAMSPVAFIIPALNEEASVGGVLDAFAEESRRLRLFITSTIVVDNGSSDHTAGVAAAHGARVISQPRRGYGWACLAGIAALPPEAQIVVFLDADGSDDPLDLAAMLQPILENQADFVLGSRTKGASEPGALTPQQQFGNWFATRLLRLLFGVNYTDLGPFRAIRRESLLALCMKDTNFGWTIEMQIKAHRMGLRVREVPVHYRRRTAGQSKISGSLRGSLLAGAKILWTVLRFRLRAGQISRGLSGCDRSRTT